MVRILGNLLHNPSLWCKEYFLRPTCKYFFIKATNPYLLTVIKILKRISEDDYDNQLTIIILKNGSGLDEFPKIYLRVDFSDGTVQEIEDLSLRIIKGKIKILENKIDTECFLENRRAYR